MFAHIERCWTRLGEEEPHWSVLTQPEFRAAHISESMSQFYQSGKHDSDLLVDAARRCNVSLPTDGVCFELGCGVGRVTIWLASLFAQVIAADVSKPHLKIAEHAFRTRNQSNVYVLPITQIDALNGLRPFDCFFSLIVLQHNPPPVIRWLLKSVLTQLRPGGVAFFQLPVHLPDYRFAADSYLAGSDASTEMEVHALPLDAVWNVLQQTDCTLLEGREYDCLGIPGARSINFFVQKRLH